MAGDESNFEAARAFVDFGLQKRQSGQRESASGPGSARQAARFARKMVETAIAERGVRRILDLGCGDWNWMREIDLRAPDGAPVYYEGWESNPGLVEELTGKFASSSTVFSLRDAVTEPFPDVDLVIARDILFHMRTDFGVQITAKARAASRYFLSTSFPSSSENPGPATYLPIDNWGFYRINLTVAPFSLADAMIEMHEEPECAHKGNSRFICLFDFTRLLPAA